ncbi:hypothetical protein [Crocosphaera sp. XPORK-15E]|nr:hypothetical protein [Crocosphaera sp. XPORK-15E]MEA5535630.1 hypothetical protein [Crocosphaera sp. XPORK-15E]
MIKTYLDSGVLIAATRGTDIASSKAILILENPKLFTRINPLKLQ